ncbi:protein CDV3 homolog isoform X2 [Nilaparvata lugens]|uniref:protein CDV3 homolog isoform X2 n=1 Tax=Nilaparvata lugens TaxID=108931 RepID=UPI00193EBC55|nr:protein CDV3 homolog isoform X2 [Nilaparvata lugens]
MISLQKKLEEDEWKDFEEEKKDYSGLKIQNLTIIENEGGEDNGEGGIEGEEDDMEENEAGEMVPRKKASGPWKCVAQPQSEESELKPEEAKEEVKVGGGGGGGGVQGSYLPPHLRNTQHHHQHYQPPTHSSPRMLKSKAAPDVMNEELFPTLSAAKSVEPSLGAWGKKRRDDGIGFEEVRNSKSHSSRFSETANRMNNSGKLSLGNKYGALTNDQS